MPPFLFFGFFFRFFQEVFRGEKKREETGFISRRFFSFRSISLEITLTDEDGLEAEGVRDFGIEDLVAVKLFLSFFVFLGRRWWWLRSK